MKRLLRIGLRIAAALAVLALLLVIAGLITVQTRWFREQVRARIISEAENATGGQVELGSFDFNWRNLTAEVRELVIRGKEGPEEAPLFHAARIRVGLRILSLVQRKVDLHELLLERPRVNILIDEQGNTNFPTPKRVRQRRNLVETVFKLAVKRFNLTQGSVRFNMRRTPVDVRGENLQMAVLYETGPGAVPAPRYRGELSLSEVALAPASLKAIPFRFDAAFALARNELRVTSARVGLRESSIDAHGRIPNLADPKLEVQYAARFQAADLAAVIETRALPTRGVIDAGGEFVVSGGREYLLSGRMKATGLAFPRLFPRLAGVAMESDYTLRPGELSLRDMAVRALGGVFRGRADLADYRRLSVEGQAQGFSIHELTHFQGIEHADWNGTVSGPVTLTGDIRRELRDMKVQGRFAIAPAEGPNPVEGQVELSYERAAGRIEFGRSRVATRASTAEFNGVLGERLEVRAASKDLRDAEPAIAMVRGTPYQLPVRLLPNGSARFDGSVSGPLRDPVIEGQAEAGLVAYEQRTVDFASADVRVTGAGVNLRNVQVRKQGMQAGGTLDIGLVRWKPEPGAPISGSLTVRAPEIRQALREAGRGEDVSGGPLTAKIALSGTIRNPQIAASLSASKLSAYGEPVDSLNAEVHFREGLLEIQSATLGIAGRQARASGSYTYPLDQPARGRAQFEVSSQGLPLSRLHAVQDRTPGLAGRLEGQIAGDISVAARGFEVHSAKGQIGIRGLAYEKERLGSLTFTADTKGSQATLNVEGELAGAKVNGRTDWTLSGDYPVQGAVEFSPMNFTTLMQRFRNFGGGGLPFDGFASGRLKFSGATTQPKSFRGTAELTQLEIRPKAASLGVDNAEPFVVRNAGAILVDFDASAARVRQAALHGRDTDLTMGGRISFTSRYPLDLRFRGQMNLALLRELDDRFYSAGLMQLDLSLRGRPARPDIYGRIDLVKAAFNWPGLPNGIDNANGLIFLYRDRATIDRITAETGGGKLELTGFFSYNPAVTFHVETKVTDVRVRYPEGVSSTAKANLTLSGTSDRSQLSGEVVVESVGFNPRSDLASILASTAEPLSAPTTPNRFLQNTRLDVHIVTSPQVRLVTKLTRDVQADADLRLRGDLTRPVVLGRVVVNEGEVLFFGNQYEIQSGQILFVNTTKIEPVVNMDLQTRARGIDVTLHVSGPVNKLNVTYRSDPPLQFSEIVALLATGREPVGTTGLSGGRQSQTQTSQSWQQAGASAILTQALANPIAGRLQRFFGVSRLKIDPQITGVTTNNAAARVTLEQQITRNLTFTYITDLSRPQAQSIRIELDLTRNWSAVAQREENGLFGIDFLFRKQFK